jgi:hypothetical protein
MKTLFKTVLFGLAMPFCVLTSYGQTLQQNDLKKAKWIKNETAAYLNQGGQTDVVPEFTTKAEKEAWFTKNNSLNPNQILPNGDIIHLDKKTDARQHVIFADDSSFPVYTQTGNQQVDDQNYDQKKQNWINQNQAKYNSKVQPASAPISKEERLKNELQPQK